MVNIILLSLKVENKVKLILITSLQKLRAKLPIGEKFSISAGAMYRTHERPYGYNPVEIWLNETDEDGFAVNPIGITLGFYYGI